MAKKKLLPNGWEDRVSDALDTLDRAGEKQRHDATHTVDGKEIKLGLKVFTLDDPTVQWSISEIEEKTYRRKVTLNADGWSFIKRSPLKLFVSQKKAVNACIEDIRQSEKNIIRDMKESVTRLNAHNRIKQMNELKKSLS